MSRTLDVLVDVTHGTVDGYREGCRGSHCPAGEEHGLSCATANRLAAGDWQYMKALRRGLTPAEIAAELGLTPAATQPAPKTKPKPREDDDDLTPDIIDEPEKEQPMPATQTPKQSEVRAWAREVGLIVPSRGGLPRNVIEAYNARGKGVQASDVKPTLAPALETAQETPAVPAKRPEAVSDPEATGGRPLKPCWSLPLTASDLRAIADATDALEDVPREVAPLDNVPVRPPGGDDEVGVIRVAEGFDDDPWLGFVPRGGAA